MYIVEVPYEGEDLALPMAQMRDWLDTNQITPALFAMSVTANSVVFRLQFTTASEAAKFAKPFGGQVVIAAVARAA